LADEQVNDDVGYGPNSSLTGVLAQAELILPKIGAQLTTSFQEQGWISGGS
jgi:hypothetical protein